MAHALGGRADVAWPADAGSTTTTEAAVRGLYGTPALAAEVTSIAGRATGPGGGSPNAAQRSTSGLALLAYDDGLSALFAKTHDPRPGRAEHAAVRRRVRRPAQRPAGDAGADPVRRRAAHLRPRPGHGPCLPGCRRLGSLAHHHEHVGRAGRRADRSAERGGARHPAGRPGDGLAATGAHRLQARRTGADPADRTRRGPGPRRRRPPSPAPGPAPPNSSPPRGGARHRSPGTPSTAGSWPRPGRRRPPSRSRPAPSTSSPTPGGSRSPSPTASTCR